MSAHRSLPQAATLRPQHNLGPAYRAEISTNLHSHRATIRLRRTLLLGSAGISVALVWLVASLVVAVFS